jgi:hypothetical protein
MIVKIQLHLYLSSVMLSILKIIFDLHKLTREITFFDHKQIIILP